MKNSIIISTIAVILITIVLSVSLSSCVSTRDTVKINKVEMGMTKNDIHNLLGTPLFKNANETGEEWGYRKMVGEIAGPEQMLFIVTFNNDGKVIAYNSVKDYTYYHPY
ncbi:MAG: outer membrane protein assembly factor BamE [Muribaculaceae bacterium]|nr:outer membrane protein assembly factor BamE [Muribaculaceae bacterium]